MNPILRNILAVIAGIILGGVVNMGLIQTGYMLFPIEGIDPNDMDALAEAMPNLGVKHFIFPFLAHAVGTFIGAYVAARFAATHKMKFAMTVGVFFLIGGIMASQMIPAPSWFIILDLVVAYIPMAWLARTATSRS